MIVVDTNVVSEAMKSEPDAKVIGWLNEQHVQSLFATTINVAKLRYGVERLPDGKRKSSLWAVLDFTMERLFETRILSFDLPAARESARIRQRRLDRRWASQMGRSLQSPGHKDLLLPHGMCSHSKQQVSRSSIPGID